MKLEEALAELRKGRKIRLKVWDDGDAVSLVECESFYITAGEFLCDDWEVIKPKPMSFGEAMKAAAEGKCVSRPKFVGWGVESDGLSIRKSVIGSIYSPTVEDVLATDWEIVE